MRPRRLKLGTHVDSGQMYRVYRNQAAAAYLSLYFFIFLSLQLLNIKHFCHTFFKNYEAYKVETWYTCGQWADVLCAPESGCYCLLVPLFFIFLFSNFQTLKIFVTLFSGSVLPGRGQWADVLCIPESGCCCLFVPLFFSFYFLSNFQTLKNFCHTFLRNCEA